jgi:hypothetical protein
VRRRHAIIHRGLLIQQWRLAALVTFLVSVFMFGGLPTFLQHDPPAPPPPKFDFARFCRERGGRVSTTPPSSVAKPQPVCTVTYHGVDYKADAITSTGFDGDASALNRQGCESAASQAGESGKSTYIFHPLTGVCERRS